MLRHVEAALGVLKAQSLPASAGNGRILPTTARGLLAKEISSLVGCYFSAEDMPPDAVRTAFDTLSSVLQFDAGAWLLLARTPSVGNWPPVNVPPELAYDSALFGRVHASLQNLQNALSLSGQAGPFNEGRTTTANNSLTFSHPVDDEAIAVLQELRPDWTPADVNGAPQLRQGAVGMLMRCGFVQGKRPMEATCDGLPGVFRALVRVSGCYDSGGVFEQFVRQFLPRQWLASSCGIRLHIRGTTALRLTMAGEEAKRDIRAGEQWKVLAFMHSLPHVTPEVVMERQEFVSPPSNGVTQMAVAQAQIGDVIVNNQIAIPPIVVNIDGAALSPTMSPVANNGSNNQATDNTDSTPPTATPKTSEGNGRTDSTPKKTRSTKAPNRGRPVDPLTTQRAAFARPLREQDQTWTQIAAAYVKKYPKDIDASADTIRLACTPKRGRKGQPK